MGQAQLQFEGYSSPEIGRSVYSVHLREPVSEISIVGPVGFNTIDSMTPQGQQLMAERLNRPVNHYVNRVLAGFRGYEIGMAKDLSPTSLYSREAILHLMWAFGQSEYVDPVERRRFAWDSSFPAVVDYSAIWTFLFSTVAELDQFYERPHYLGPHLFERNPKIVHTLDDIEPGCDQIMIHGRYAGGFIHPGQARAIDNMIRYKRKHPNTRLMVGVDSAFNFVTGCRMLVSPLFAMSVLALHPEIDYVHEIRGPDSLHWRSSFMTDGPGLTAYPLHYKDGRWDTFYEGLYRKFGITGIHIRETDPYYAERMERAERLGIVPIIHHQRDEYPVYSDSILRGLARRYHKDQETGRVECDDYEEESKEMCLWIQFKEIPELEERRMAGIEGG